MGPPIASEFSNFACLKNLSKKKGEYEASVICSFLFLLALLTFLLLSFLPHHLPLFFFVFFFPVFIFFHVLVPQKSLKAQQGVYMHFVQRNMNKNPFLTKIWLVWSTVFALHTIFHHVSEHACILRIS
jgi:hypothetical protein